MAIKYHGSEWKPSSNDYRKVVRRRLVINRQGQSSQTPQKQKSKGGFKLWRIIKGRWLKLLLQLVVLGVVALLLLVLIVSRDLPNPNQLINREVAQSTKIYDRTGKTILYEVSGDQKRTLVTLDQIPPYVKQATIAIEDKNFYNHGAFSVWSMIRTFVTNILYQRLAGGSTLTQQFVKNAILSNEKTLTRKIKELILAQRIESKFSKDEILQMYLNEIPYGSSAYGVEAASQKYFAKDVKDVDLAEAAILAALPQAPSRYSPYGPNKDLLLKRQKTVLDVMAEQGYITPAQRDIAKKEEVKFAPLGKGIIAPHFVMYVKEMLTEKYGDKTVEQGGLKVITTLDTDKQKFAEDAVTNRTVDYQKKYNASNAALVSIDPKTGQILAMVGSRDYFNDAIDGQVNIATSLRQPGSSMKPIVYSALFMKGYTPNTILDDVVINFAPNSTTPYIPHDYDSKERGPISIRNALAGSLNIPAVEAIYLAGIDNVISLAQKMGYTSLTDPSRYGLSLVLGGAEVKLLEHTNAYAVLAQEGTYHPISAILKVEDKNGQTLEEYKEQDSTVMPSKIVDEITSIMTDNNARAYIFGEKNYLTLPSRPVAAKTGTTNDFKDAWTMGFTPSLVTGVWVGNNNATAMKTGSDGSILAAPIWNDYMKNALANTPVENFNSPSDLTTGKAVIDGETYINHQISIDTRTNALADASTPSEFLKTVSYSDPHSILYYVNKEDPLGPAPSNPENDPQFVGWEAAVKTWAEKNNIISTPEYNIDLNTETPNTNTTTNEFLPLETTSTIPTN